MCRVIASLVPGSVCLLYVIICIEKVGLKKLGPGGWLED